MTLADVQQAKQALEAEGTYPSHKAILAYLGRGSKRDVARLLHALVPTPGPDPAAAVAQVVARVDAAVGQLAVAQAARARSAADLTQSREACLAASTRLQGALGVLTQGVRVGGLMPSDPVRTQLQREAEQAEADYRACWVVGQRQEEEVTRARQALQRAQQAAWVAQAQPGLAVEVERCTRALTAASQSPDLGRERAVYVARHALQQAQFAYAQACGAAPVPVEGDHP